MRPGRLVLSVVVAWSSSAGSAGAQRAAPDSMALSLPDAIRRAVIGGLITSTLLTLVVVPVAYTYLDNFGGWVGALDGGRTR
jgi:hypothetical protein